MKFVEFITRTLKTRKMKKTTNILIMSIFYVVFLPGCHVDNASVVETKKETTECVVGKWMPENQDKELNILEFNAANIEGGETGTVILSGGVEGSNGTWQYQSIGEIKISTPSSELNFKLLNCNRGILDGLTIYVKE
jgi:hypothetical protein